MDIEARIKHVHQIVELLIEGLNESIDKDNLELEEKWNADKNLQKELSLESYQIWKPRGESANKIWMNEITHFVFTAIAMFVQKSETDDSPLLSIAEPTWKNLFKDIESYCDPESPLIFRAWTFGILAKRGIPDVVAAKLIAALSSEDFLSDFLPEYLGYCYEPILEYRLDTIDNKIQLVNGSDRRDSGSHYTPISTSHEIVRHTIDPLIFKGCRDGKPETEWELISSEEILELKICDPSVGCGIFLLQTCRYMAGFLVEAWKKECQYLDLSHDEKLLKAKRAIASRCLYGLDINRVAVEITRLALKLETSVDFIFLQNHIKCGDALLGVTVKQVAARSLKVTESQLGLEESLVKETLREMAIARENAMEIPEDLKRRWDELKAIGDKLIESEIKNK